MQEEIAVLKRMLERERQARKHAEKTLEKKSLELEILNGQLRELVDIKTEEVEMLSQIPRLDPSPVMHIAMDGSILYANKSSNKLLTFWDVQRGQKCPEEYQIIIEKSLQRELTLEVEIVDTLHEKTYSFIFKPVVQTKSIFAYGRDITSRKRVQLALQESKNSYKQLVEEAMDIIHRTDIEGNFTYVSPISNRIVGYESDELIGINYTALIREDYKRQAITHYMNQLSERNTESYFEFPILTKTKKEIWIGQSSKILFRNDEPIGFHSIARDITDRKRIQTILENTTSRLNTLIAHIHSGLLMIDENENIVIANETYRQFLGLPLSQDILCGKPFRDTIQYLKDVFKNSESFEERIHTILTDRKPVIGEEMELLDGRFIERDCIPIYNENIFMGYLWKYRDVTEAKTSTQRLERQKDFYESILNNIPTDIAVFDKEHRYLFLNPEAIKNPELRKWIIGKDDYEYIRYKGKDTAIADDRRRRFNKVLQSGQLLKWEEKLSDAQGNPVFRLRHMCPVVDSTGEVINVIGLGLDITNEKIIENELRENEQNLKIINDISHELTTNHDFKISIYNALTDFNKASDYICVNIYEVEENPETKIYEMHHRYGLSGEDKTFVTNLASYRNISFESLLNWQQQYCCTHGECLLIERDQNEHLSKIIHHQNTSVLILVPLMVGGRLWGIMAFEYQGTKDYWNDSKMGILLSFSNTISDAISREESDNKLKAIVTSLDDIVLQINKDFQYEEVWVSDNSKLQFPREKYINKYITDVVNKELAEIFIKAINEVFLTREIKTFVYYHPISDRYYRCKICYLTTESVSALVQDVTDQKLSEFELIKAREKAEQSVKAKEHFMANMSHEIRTPMNAIVGMSRLLEKTILTNQQKNFLKAISVSADNLLIIIDDILDFSKIESNKLTLERIGFKVPEVIADVIQTIQYKAEEKGIALTHTIGEDISAVLIGDPSRLRQVLLNLVNNALKFTSKGGVHIECHLESKNAQTNKICFSVKDSGIGIDKNKLERIFESFAQEDETITRRYGGTGLGLSICKELIEMQGGHIHVESQKNVGTKFFFTLEYSIGSEKDLPLVVKQITSKVEMENIKVLLVEDNEINQFLAQTILENRKMLVEVAENGLIAIEKMKSQEFDIVLMDMQMPVMGGVEAARIIREELRIETPIIALTANAIKGDDKICLDAGMNDYVSKPFDEEELIRKITFLLNQHLKHDGSVREDSEKYLPVEELFSLKKLQEMSRGNDAFVVKMVRMFMENTPQSVSLIKTSFYTHDFDKMKSIAHSIKPSIDFLEIHEITEDIRKIESYSSSGNQVELEQLVLKLETIINQVIIQLKKLNY